MGDGAKEPKQPVPLIPTVRQTRPVTTFQQRQDAIKREAAAREVAYLQRSRVVNAKLHENYASTGLAVKSWSLVRVTSDTLRGVPWSVRLGNVEQFVIARLDIPQAADVEKMLNQLFPGGK